MKTYTFYQKNCSAIMTLNAQTFDEAEDELSYIVKDMYGWRCDDEDGEPVE
jgi:hypothetical protein